MVAITDAAEIEPGHKKLLNHHGTIDPRGIFMAPFVANAQWAFIP